MIDPYVVPNKSASMTFVPDAFLPVIGLVMVTHAFMDNKLQEAICFVGEINYSVGVSFLSEMQATSKRADIFTNLVRTKEPSLSKLAKMLVLGDRVVELSKERNIIAHSVPYWTNFEKSEIGYFKEVNKTVPQIAVQPPYIATIDSLTKLAREMELVAIWLGRLVPHVLPDGLDLEGKTHEETIEFIRSHVTPHPHWNDDAQFPWLDRFQNKLKNESRKPQNSHRTPNPPPQS